jgi:hypothetical protein
MHACPSRRIHHKRKYRNGLFLTTSFDYCFLNFSAGGARAFSGSAVASSVGKVTQVIGAVVDVQVSHLMI